MRRDGRFLSPVEVENRLIGDAMLVLGFVAALAAMLLWYANL